MMDRIEDLLRAGLRLGGWASRFVPTSLGRLHVMEAPGTGSGPPLALVHGLSSTGVHFLPMLPALRAASRRVILPDLPGHGLSPPLPDHAGVQQLQQGLVELLDGVLGEPAVLFGSSLGAVATIRYAIERPRRVRGLVLCSPAGAPCDREELRRIVDQFRITSHGKALDFVDRLLNEPSGPFRHVLAMGVRWRFAPESLQRQLSSIGPEDLLTAEQLAGIRAPTLLIWGQDDRILPRSHLGFFRKSLVAGTRVIEPEGIGHAPYLQAPGVIARALIDFMKETEAPSAGVVLGAAA